MFPNDTNCDIQSWKRVKLNERDISVRIDAEEHNSELVNYSGPTVRGIVGLDTAQKRDFIKTSRRKNKIPTINKARLPPSSLR